MFTRELRGYGHSSRDPDYRALMDTLGVKDEMSRLRWPLPNMAPSRMTELLHEMYRARAVASAVEFIEDGKVVNDHLFLVWVDVAHLAKRGFVARYRIDYRPERESVAVFTFGSCAHEWRERTIGNCHHEVRCAKCGSVYDYHTD